MHGYGDNAKNFSSLAHELTLKDTLWIFLQAPEALPFPGDGGQWYELFGNPHGQFYSSLQKVIESSRIIQDALKLGWNKFIFLGFSQGAFLSLFSALTHPEKVAAVVALSGYLAQSHKLADLPHARQDLPVFLGHGLHDQVVFPAQHFETRDILSHFGFQNITAKTYAGVAHSLCAEELFDIRTFIEGLT
jgi:predicted esterase